MTKNKETLKNPSQNVPAKGGVKKAQRFRHAPSAVRAHSRTRGKITLTSRERLAVKLKMLTKKEAMAQARARARAATGTTNVKAHKRRHTVDVYFPLGDQPETCRDPRPSGPPGPPPPPGDFGGPGPMIA